MKQILFAIAILSLSFSAHADFHTDGIKQIEQFMATVNGPNLNMVGSTSMQYEGGYDFTSKCEGILFTSWVSNDFVPSFSLQITTNSGDPKLENDVTKLLVSDGNGSTYSPDSGNYNAAIQDSNLEIIENSNQRLEFTATTTINHNHDGPSAGTTDQEDDQVVVTKDSNGNLTSIEIKQHRMEAFQFWANPFSPPILETRFTANCCLD